MFFKRLKVIFFDFYNVWIYWAKKCIKFCLRNKWYKDFKEGRERVDDLERPGRPWTSTDKQHIKQIKELVYKNRRLTIRDLADTIGISRGSLNTVPNDILGNNSWFLHHDNAPSHTALVLRDYFAKNSAHIVLHHQIRLIWLCVTSGYYPNSKDESEDTVLTRLKGYKPNRRRLWRQLRKSNWTSVSTFVKNVGISALYRKGFTLKGMKLIWIHK